MSDTRPLGSTGQIHVTLAAAESYADARRLGLEAARRELVTLLLAARPTTPPRTGLEGWRARSRPLDVDVTAHVSREAGLAVVVHVSVRAASRGPGAGARARRDERRRAR